MNTKLNTLTVIRVAAIAIMGIAAWVSYGTQQALLLGWGVDLTSADLLPLTVDLLAISCNVAIHHPQVTQAGRKAALRMLILAGAVSMTANFLAGENWGSRFAHLWAVAAYLGAEYLAAKCKPETKDRARSDAAKRGVATRKANATKAPAKPATRQRRLAAVPS